MGLKNFFRFGEPKEFHGAEANKKKHSPGTRLLVAAVALGLLVSSPIASQSAQASGLFTPSDEGKVNRLFPIEEHEDAKKHEGLNIPRPGKHRSTWGGQYEQDEQRGRTAGSYSNKQTTDIDKAVKQRPQSGSYNNNRSSTTQGNATRSNQGYTQRQARELYEYKLNRSGTRIKLVIHHLNGKKTTISPDTSAISSCFNKVREREKFINIFLPTVKQSMEFCIRQDMFNDWSKGSTRGYNHERWAKVGGYSRYRQLRNDLTWKQLNLDYQNNRFRW